MMLAIAPSNASPIWPASGIALAAALIWGRKIIPGLLIGAYAAQLYSFLDYTSTEKVMFSLLLAGIIAVGSVAQAVIGAWLIEKFVGRNDPLIFPRKIIAFQILGGPVSCIIAATVGATTILFGKVIHVDDYLLTWGTWWVGDTIGVAVFAPVMLILFGKPREIWYTRIKTVLLPLVVMIVLVMGLFQYGKWQDWQRITYEFERQVNLLHQTVAERIQQQINLNTALKAFFDTSETVSERQFDIFAETLLTHQSNVKALEWIPRITNEMRPGFESGWNGHMSILEPGGNGNMYPATEKNEYFPIRYVIPAKGNEMVVGYNIFINSLARVTLEHARDTATTVVSVPLRLLQDEGKNHKIGNVFYSPVYGSRDISDIKSRRSNFKGVVASIFYLGDEITNALKQFSEINLYLKVSDNGKLLFSNSSNKTGHDIGNVNLREIISLAVANRIWTFIYTPSETFFHKNLYWNLWFLLLVGMLVTGLTGCGLLMLTGNTMRTEELVKERTLELEKEGKGRKLVINEREAQNRILRAIVSAAPLDDILLMLVNMTETINPDQICSILLLDENGRHVKHGVAPGLPDFFNESVNGLEIGYGRGSCGTAMYSGKSVVVEDIQTHPFWDGSRELASKAGLRACWSEPILGPDTKVLGSFAIYFRTPRSPTDEDMRKIQDLAQLASIAIERKTRERQIQRLAFYDVLTDLPNRRLLLEWLEQQIASACRHNTYGAILYIDLDNFKTLNDSLGHQIGDQLLVQVAERLKSCIREEDTAARLGGDEFVILLRDTYPDKEKISEHLLILAKRIQAELNKPFNLDDYIHHVTPSLGITIFSKDNNKPDEILRQADAAMYSAKAKGRNTISFYHPDMQKYALDRLELEQDLRMAIREQQFILHYQPIYNDKLEIIGAEALIRWRHPVRGMIQPNEFIPEAEESGLIVLIGEWILAEVCQQLIKWNKLKYISVNISPVQMKQTDFVEMVKSTASRTGINHNQLLLEMTETSMISDIENTKIKMEALRNLGIRLSVDDFGTGYSSLVYLKNLPLNQLKIDRGFVTDLETDISDRTIVETIIIMAQHLNLKVIAEGIESDYQFSFLRGKGCNGYQGYYFSKPLSAEQFTRILERAEKAGVV